MRKKGFALIAVIILILFVGMAILGSTQFIGNRFKGFDTWLRVSRARYNAQAGIYYAVYQYRNSGTTFASGTTVNIDANNSFRFTSVGGGSSGAASSLVINATASSTGGTGNRDLLGITLQNTSASPITIASMNITWNNTRSLNQVVINGVTVFTGTVVSPGGNVNITNTTIPASTTRPLTRLRFSGNMTGTTITIQCVMTDATSTSVCTVLPTPVTTCTTPGGNLTITSTGKTANSGLYKTIQATYIASTGNISAYQEINTSVP
ncbi:MAG: hypothetical protein PHO70_01845 [Candidatus Omnitrophica bacterium]|nr:hypothetical protein [Candidatus Omnitrophota bacterium]